MLRREAIELLTKYQELFFKIQELLGLKKSRKIQVEWGKFTCSNDNDYSDIKVKFQSETSQKGVIVYFNHSHFNPSIVVFGDAKIKTELETTLKEGTSIRTSPFMQFIFYRSVSVILKK